MGDIDFITQEFTSINTISSTGAMSLSPPHVSYSLLMFEESLLASSPSSLTETFRQSRYSNPQMLCLFILLEMLFPRYPSYLMETFPTEGYPVEADMLAV